MSIFKNIFTYCFLSVAAVAFTGCDDLIYDYEGDCVYHVRFRYDYNMKWADAFNSEVTSVTLHVIDSEGRCVWSRTESGENLRKDNYEMQVVVPPGRYSLQAWAGDRELGSFDLMHDDAIEGHTARMVRDIDQDGTHNLRRPLDRLYHGYLSEREFSADYGDTFVIPLVKDTNGLRIVLQHLSGLPINANAFDYKIIDANGSLDCYNNINDQQTIHYHPWDLRSGMTTIDGKDPDSRAQTTYSAAIAEFTLSRLIDSNALSSRLVITLRESGREIVSIPLIDALLLVRSNYHRPDSGATGGQVKPLSDQEYLDRQDDYSLTFFLDKDENWVNTHIYINSWHVVLNPPVDL